MKYTDKFFKFPIKIYDGFSVAKAMVVEDKKFETQDVDSITGPEPVDWVIGYVKMPIKEILGWADQFSDEMSTEQVAKDGFDQTRVVTKNLGNLECPWVRKRFEEEINSFHEKREIEKPQSSL